jgi:hypothetical protein
MASAMPTESKKGISALAAAGMQAVETKFPQGLKPKPIVLHFRHD